MRWDLINQLVETYEGSNLLEDVKLAVAQAVVNRCPDSKTAQKELGLPRTTLDSWFRKGWLLKPAHYPNRGDNRFKKGHKISAETEKKRRAGLKRFFTEKGYKVSKLADA